MNRRRTLIFLCARTKCSFQRRFTLCARHTGGVDDMNVKLVQFSREFDVMQVDHNLGFIVRRYLIQSVLWFSDSIGVIMAFSNVIIVWTGICGASVRCLSTRPSFTLTTCCCWLDVFVTRMNVYLFNNDDVCSDMYIYWHQLYRP